MTCKCQCCDVDRVFTHAVNALVKTGLTEEAARDALAEEYRHDRKRVHSGSDVVAPPIALTPNSRHVVVRFHDGG